MVSYTWTHTSSCTGILYRVLLVFLPGLNPWFKITRDIYVHFHMWVIPLGWGILCDGVPWYIRNIYCLLFLHYLRVESYYSARIKHTLQELCKIYISVNLEWSCWKKMFKVTDVTRDTVTMCAPTWWNDCSAMDVWGTSGYTLADELVFQLLHDGLQSWWLKAMLGMLSLV